MITGSWGAKWSEKGLRNKVQTLMIYHILAMRPSATTSTIKITLSREIHFSNICDLLPHRVRILNLIPLKFCIWPYSLYSYMFL